MWNWLKMSYRWCRIVALINIYEASSTCNANAFAVVCDARAVNNTVNHLNENILLICIFCNALILKSAAAFFFLSCISINSFRTPTTSTDDRLKKLYALHYINFWFIHSYRCSGPGPAIHEHNYNFSFFRVKQKVMWTEKHDSRPSSFITCAIYICDFFFFWFQISDRMRAAWLKLKLCK